LLPALRVRVFVDGVKVKSFECQCDEELEKDAEIYADGLRYRLQQAEKGK